MKNSKVLRSSILSVYITAVIDHANAKYGYDPNATFKSYLKAMIKISHKFDNLTYC